MLTKFKNRRKRSGSEEVASKKRRKSVLKNYLPKKQDNIVEVESAVSRMKEEGSSMSKEEVISTSPLFLLNHVISAVVAVSS